MKIASNIGQLIQPQSVTKVTKYIARIDNGKYGIKFMRINQLSSRLRSMMA